jgi:hypothetical protein
MVVEGPRHPWRRLSRWGGALLCLVGLVCGCLWFYVLAPRRHIWDPAWRSAHSRREHWRETQTAIRRGMWEHDDAFAVGLNGDKAWAEWIMARLKPGADMGCFGRLGHSATAMRFITNQDVGGTADAWLAWWAENKSKSQEEWVADGFRQRGCGVDMPPKPEQFPALLGLLGDGGADKPATVPRHVKYNAFRCLRDAGFEPVAFALANRQPSAEIQRGLLEYAKREHLWPAADGVGILAFGQKGPEDLPIPALLEPWSQAIAYALIFVPLLLGGVLLVRSFRGNSRAEERGK